MNNEICHEHSGLVARIESLEGGVKDLSSKWDSMQKLLIGTLVSAVLSFIGILAMFIRMIAS